MANNCYNELEIKGSVEDIKRLEECITTKDEKGNEEWDLSNIIPVETDDDGFYKVDDIYKLWGTKWFEGEYFENHGNSATLTFNTAWSPSLPVTLEMSKKFNLKINHFYEEAGNNFEGDYKVDNGEVLLDVQRKYSPLCVECNEKDDSENLCYDEDEGEYFHLRCRDEFVGIVEEKLENIKKEKENKN